MNSWKIIIDNIIKSTCQFISTRSTFESIQDPKIFSYLVDRLLKQDDIRQDLMELMFEYIRKHYDFQVFVLDESHIETEALHQLSRRLMDGFYTYSPGTPVDKEFRVYINYLICSCAFEIIVL